MNKFLVYTSNLPFAPKNMNDVINFAKDECKFMIAPVELNTHLADVKVGDNIITKKGNSIFVIKTISESMDSLSAEDQEYLDTLTREYNLKKVNITSVANRIKFTTWCKEAQFLNNSKNSKNSNKMEKKTINGMVENLKNMFMPTEVNNIRVATDGNLCVETDNGYVAIDAKNNLTSYPEDFTLDLPVFVICKPQSQLAVGDIIAVGKSYAKVTKIDGSKITAIGYTGAGKTIHTIKDFLFNQTMVRVAVSLVGNIGGQMNPMMLLALSKDKKDDSLLPLLMMSQNAGNIGMNPMMMLALSKGGDNSSLKDLMLMSAMSGNGMNLGNLFGQTPAVPNAMAPAKHHDVAEDNDNTVNEVNE